MKLILIAAMAHNRVIGHNNRIPWHIPEEIHFFKHTTMGHAVIMGRKTYESIAKPLPGRFNVVLSRNPASTIQGCRMAIDLEAGIANCKDYEKVFIIGGSSLFEEAMAVADSILLSILDRDYAGDTFFPTIPVKRFRLASESTLVETPTVRLQEFQRRAVAKP